MILYTLHAHLLIFVSLFTLICSDSALSYFQEIETGDIVTYVLEESFTCPQVVHTVTPDKRTPFESIFDGTVESCANQCLLTKFFCRSFMLVERGDELHCVMVYIRKDNLMDYFTPFSTAGRPDAIMVAAYDIKEKIDNVATISKIPSLLSEEKFDELLHGYGLYESLDGKLWACLKEILRACITALHLPKSEPTSFAEWVRGEESPSAQQSMSLSASKYTDNDERPRKRTRHSPASTPDNNLLTFLDLFSRAIDRRTRTIYDRDRLLLYIDSPDLHVLIYFRNHDTICWAGFGNKVPGGSVSLSFRNNGLEPEDPTLKVVWKAASHFSPKTVTVYPDSSYFYGIGHKQILVPLIRLLIGGERLLFDGSHNALLFQDLSQVVPSILSQPSSVFTRIPNLFTSDVQLNTFRK